MSSNQTTEIALVFISLGLFRVAAGYALPGKGLIIIRISKCFWVSECSGSDAKERLVHSLPAFLDLFVHVDPSRIRVELVNLRTIVSVDYDFFSISFGCNLYN